jgi:GNAT superfamily N-acetyltransferase
VKGLTKEVAKLLTLRPIESDRDWQEVLAIRKVLYPEFPISLAEIQANDKLLADKVHIRRLICRNGAVVGMAAFVEAHYVAEVGVYVTRVICMPDDLESFRFGCVQAIQWGEEQNARAVMTGVEDRRQGMADAAKDLGWVTKQEQKVTRLDLAGFSLENKELDWEIVSLPDFKRLRPETWLHEYWTLETALMKDVPLPGEYKEPDIEVFEQHLESPGFCWEGAFLALVDGEIAGMASISPCPGDPAVGSTALTGVLRGHRRKGIARALKIHCLQWAKTQGVEFVVTDNEENNPMYLLNVELGFRHVFNQLWMARETQQAES